MGRMSGWAAVGCDTQTIANATVWGEPYPSVQLQHLTGLSAPRLRRATQALIVSGDLTRLEDGRVVRNLWDPARYWDWYTARVAAGKRVPRPVPDTP